MKSIAVKLWGAMIFLIVGVLLLLWLFQIMFLESFYRTLMIKDIKEEASYAVAQLEQGHNEKFEQVLEAQVFENHSYAMLIDEKGITTKVYSNQEGPAAMPMRFQNYIVEGYQQVIQGKTFAASMMHSRFTSETQLLGFPIHLSDGTKQALMIIVPIAPVESTAQILKQQLVYITVILLLASILLSYILTKHFTKPILLMTKVSEKMAVGDFSERIKIQNEDEIGKLASSLNKMAQELSKIEQLRKDLIANISHELRTPLSLIRGYAETLRDVNGHIEEKRQKNLGLIIEESGRVSQIVNEILNLSQMQAGYFQIEKSEFFLCSLLKEVTQKFETLSNKTEITLQISPCEELKVLADPLRIQQVLYNLIQNAFNHSSNGDKITISVLKKSGKARIEVEDLGEGIAQEDLQSIWDRYYRGQSYQKSDKVGTGLGLAIVKSVIKAHGGSFGVESELGKGSIFWFEIELACEG